MPISQELENYLTSSPFDKSVCHVAGPHIDESPLLVFILSSASEQGLQPEKETIVSELVRQLVQDAGMKDIFTESIDIAPFIERPDASEADARLQAGEIDGVQHARFLSSAPLTIVSLDEKQDYKNYVDVLNKWNAGKERIEKALSLVNSALKRTVVLGNKTIQALLIRREAYRGGRISLSEYIRNVTQQAEALGIALKDTRAVWKFHRLALKEQNIEVEQAKQEIERFADKLMEALGEKEVWLRQTIEALSSAQPGETHEIEAQLQFLVDYLSNSLMIRKLKESLFFRIAMYGAHREGFSELEKPREMASRGRREKAFISGVLQGPTHILMHLVKKLLAAESQQNCEVPDIYDFILDVGVFAGFSESDMPHLIEYVQYGNRYKALMTSRLLKEIETLEHQILEKSAATDQDREVVELHTLFDALRKRVLVQLEWGEAAHRYARESQQDNYALQLKQRSLLQNTLKKETLVVLDVLSQAESLAREYYQRLGHRSQIMAAKLRAEISERKLEQAVVYASEYSCKSLLVSLKQLLPHSSYTILIPFPGSDRTQEPDFSRFYTPPKEVPDAANIAIYRNPEEDLGVLLRKHCENPLCRFSAPAIYERVICLTQPGSQGVFYCDTCNKLYCGLELKPMYMSEQDFEKWLGFNPLMLMEKVEGKPPFSLQCRHCGSLVGKGKKAIVWNIDK